MFYVVANSCNCRTGVCLWLQIKIKDSAHGWRRSVLCAKGASNISPSPSSYLQVFFVRFVLLVVSRHTPFGSVCLALRFLLLKCDIWALLKIKCFLQQVARGWLRSQRERAPCLDHTWTFVAYHPALSILLSQVPFLECSWTVASGGHPHLKTFLTWWGVQNFQYSHHLLLISCPSKCKRKLTCEE